MIKTLIIFVIFYVLIILYFSINQSRFLYFPHKEIIDTPSDIGLNYEKISVTADDSTKISSWYIPEKDKKKVILICHGNAGNISHRLETIHLFNRLGLNVMIFDYRGYGKSGGKVSEEGTYLDVKAVYDFLIKEKKYSPEDIIVFGRSMGGSIAAWLAQSYKVNALIVESAFTSVPDLGAQLYPYIPVRLLSRYKYNTKKYIQNVSCPVLVIHSRDDDIVPFSHGKELFKTANEPKEFLEIRGSHNDGFIISEELYIKTLSKFFRELV